MKYGSSYLGQTTRPCNSRQKNNKKRSCRIVNFAVPTDNRVKMNESELRDK